VVKPNSEELDDQLRCREAFQVFGGMTSRRNEQGQSGSREEREEDLVAPAFRSFKSRVR
jgi:hypothetical protein